MKSYIEERAIEIAKYIIEHNATVRQTAKEFGISKSTVHKDVTERLQQKKQDRFWISTSRSVISAVDLTQERNIYIWDTAEWWTILKKIIL